MLKLLSQRALRQLNRRPWAALFCAAWLLWATACKSDYPVATKQARAGAADAANSKPVRLGYVAELPVGETVKVNGTLAAYDQTTVSVKAPGRLRVITVDLGSVVQRGQLLAAVETQDYQIRIEQAEASVSQARARLGLAPEGTDDQVDPTQTGTVRQARTRLEEARINRQRSATLVEQGVVARAELDAVDAAFKVAESQYQDALEEIRNRQAILAQRRAELALARQQLTDTNIYAPSDGLVQEKRASTGEYLATGAPLLTLVRVNPLRLRAEVPERDAASIHTGQSVRVTVEGDASVYPGSIKRLSPSISEASRVLIVEADVANNGRLRPGAFARAEIVTSNASRALTVPTEAIVTFAGIEKVITVKDGKAVEKTVTSGRKTTEWTEILNGVSVGEQVVLSPGNIQSGQAVNISE